MKVVQIQYYFAKNKRTVSGNVPFVYYIQQKEAIKASLLLYWSEYGDSNPGPLRPERSALPSCAILRHRVIL